jgi:organic hydroperoxide reductase OsmC/OhrA
MDEQHIAVLTWQREGEFSHTGYNKQHQALMSGHILPMAAADDENNADPEQALTAALSSCFMLTFLALAAKKRLVVESYQDTAVGLLAQREDGKFWVSQITLRPRVVFSGNKIPTADEIHAMHAKAHQHCFIANSIKSAVVVEPQI